MRHLLHTRPKQHPVRTFFVASLSMLLILGQPAIVLATDDSPPADPSTISSTEPAASAGPAEGPESPPSTPSSPEPTSSVAPADEQQATNTTSATVENTTDTQSHSGDSQVESNTSAGGATTGSSISSATVINTVSADTGTSAQPVNTFVKNVTGDSKDDIVIDPSSLLTGSGSLEPDVLTVKNDATLAIQNDLTVGSTSGNATVYKNTTAGDAATGQAQATANVINSLNSTVSSQGSFIGVINIAGDFTGDILLPDAMMENLYLAAGAVTDLRNTTTVGITNDITADAESGTATVTGNTTAGKATTGDATTKVTLLDVIAQNIQADRALLVFVNVLGTWTGMMWQSAASPTSHPVVMAEETSVDNSLHGTIHNDIDVSARSGNALVERNTTAGNATSGDAAAQVNLLNMVNASFQVSDWFGVLFINILGDWTGNLGINAQTSEPDQPKPVTKPVPVVKKAPAPPHPKAAAPSGNHPLGQHIATIVTSITSQPASPAAQGSVSPRSSEPTGVLAAAEAEDSPVAIVATNGQTDPPASGSGVPSGAERPVIGLVSALSLAAAFGGLRLLRINQSGVEL